jgi:hypothetical protein
VRLNGLPEGTSLRCGLWRCVPLLRRAPRGDRGPKRRALCLRRCGRSAPPVRRPRRLQGIADVVPQLEPIRDPERVRRGLATSQRLGSGSLTGQDGSPGLALHPRDPGLSGACLENGDGLATFPSNDHGAVGRAAASGERLAPQDPRCDSGTRLGTRSADERIRPAPLAKQPGDARRHLGTAGMRQFQQALSPALGLPRIRGQEPRKGGNAAAGVDAQRHRPASPGDIPRVAVISAMPPRAPGATPRTGDGPPPRFPMEHRSVPLRGHRGETPEDGIRTTRFPWPA